jgi:hypothetical protein
VAWPNARQLTIKDQHGVWEQPFTSIYQIYHADHCRSWL